MLPVPGRRLPRPPQAAARRGRSRPARPEASHVPGRAGRAGRRSRRRLRRTRPGTATASRSRRRAVRFGPASVPARAVSETTSAAHAAERKLAGGVGKREIGVLAERARHARAVGVERDRRRAIRTSRARSGGTRHRAARAGRERPARRRACARDSTAPGIVSPPRYQSSTPVASTMLCAIASARGAPATQPSRSHRNRVPTPALARSRGVRHRIGGHDATRVARRQSSTNDTAALDEQLRDEPGQGLAMSVRR